MGLHVHAAESILAALMGTLAKRSHALACILPGMCCSIVTGHLVAGQHFVLKSLGLINCLGSQRRVLGPGACLAAHGSIGCCPAQLAALKMNPDFLNRDVNANFSGGEKKRNEILQLSVLEVGLPWLAMHFPACSTSPPCTSLHAAHLLGAP